MALSGGSWQSQMVRKMNVVQLQCDLRSLEDKQHSRGAWKKALSDVSQTTRFSFQIALYLLVRQKENLTLHQVSLRALFRASVHLKKKAKKLLPSMQTAIKC